MEHHNIFSLEQNEIGCTDTAEHVIELLDTKPFKERFWRIAPPLVEEVREHIQEMLDRGAIRPSQSPLVQRGSPCEEKGWGSQILHRLLPAK